MRVRQCIVIMKVGEPFAGVNSRIIMLGGGSFDGGR
jgi:hypothetical protein